MFFKELRTFFLESVSLSVLCAAGGIAFLSAVGGCHWLVWVRQIPQIDDGIRAVVLTSYNGLRSIRVVNNFPSPAIQDKDDVKIQVIASGVDPVDIKISRGYGRNLRSHLHRYHQHCEQEFPIVLGRECSGIVTDVGSNVTSVIKGDFVWAFSNYYQEGLMSEFVVVNQHQVSLKPKNLSFAEAAALPYAAMISWNALANECQLQPNGATGKRILVHSGNTACGVIAVQLAKAWGGHVTTTVPTIGLPMSHELDADDVVVFSVTDFEYELLQRKRFDVVLNSAGTILHDFCIDICKPGGKVVTLVSTPLLSDKFGLYMGGLLSLLLQAYLFFKKVQHGLLKQLWWGSFSLDTRALDMVSELVHQGKIRPVVEEIYPVEKAAVAFQNVAKYETIGKTVVTFQHSLTNIY